MTPTEVQALKTSRRANAILLALAFACAANFVCPLKAAAQTGERRASARERKQSARAREEEARRRADVREAIAALSEAADAARSFDDAEYKVRIQADAADVLWPFDEQAARSILRRAWEVTTAPGAIDAFRWKGGDVTEQDDDSGAIESILTARRLVAACAAKHDARLADVYMKSLTQGLDSDESAARGEGDPQSALSGGRLPSPASYQRLQTASALLEEGAYEAAAAVVAPTVNDGVNGFLLDIIIELRAHAPREGDALYLRLLERTRRDPRADANDVLMLSQPIVSPGLLVLINADGSAHFRQVSYRDAAMGGAFEGAPPEVRRAFYSTAAAVLLRPARQAAEGAPTGAAASALYFAVGRLLPFFEREAAQYAPALHARMGALAAEISASRAQLLDAKMNTLSLASKNPVDPLASQLEVLSRLDDADARDGIRQSIVTNAARHMLWERARAVANEIEDSKIRREALRTIAVYQVMSVASAYDDEPDGHERAADFARAADVPQGLRAAGLARAAELAARLGKSERADALFVEALTYANQAGKDDDTRLAAFMLVAHSAERAGSARLWETLPALVASANESEEYSEAGPHFSLDYGYPGGSVLLYEPDVYLNFEDAFVAAARLDFRRALTEVHSLEDKLTRASVTVAAARAALEKQDKAKGERPR